MAIRTFGTNAVDWEQRVDLIGSARSGWPGSARRWSAPRSARC